MYLLLLMLMLVNNTYFGMMAYVKYSEGEFRKAFHCLLTFTILFAMTISYYYTAQIGGLL